MCRRLRQRLRGKIGERRFCKAGDSKGDRRGRDRIYLLLELPFSQERQYSEDYNVKVTRQQARIVRQIS